MSDELGFSLNLPEGDTAVRYIYENELNSSAGVSQPRNDGYRIRCVNYINIVVPAAIPVAEASEAIESSPQAQKRAMRSTARESVSRIPKVQHNAQPQPQPKRIGRPPKKRTRSFVARESVPRIPKVQHNAQPQPQPKRRGRPPKKRTRSSDRLPSEASVAESDHDSDSVRCEVSSSSEEEEEEDSQDSDSDGPAVRRRESHNVTSMSGKSQALHSYIDNQPFASFFKTWLGKQYDNSVILSTGKLVPLFHSKVGRTKSRSPLYLLLQDKGIIIMQKLYDGSKHDRMKVRKIYAWECVKSLTFFDDLVSKVMLRFALYPESPNVQYYKDTGRSTKFDVNEEDDLILFVKRGHDMFSESAWDACFKVLCDGRRRYKIPKQGAT